jgi:2-oxoglutarate dehydrogenase E1 component
MMPKSLLRHRSSTSTLDELTEGGLAEVLAEIDPIESADVRRVVLCSGKVFFDLLAARQQRGITDIAILRVEQLYPFPRRQLRELLDQYSGAREIVWCQEDPRNQGAWYQIQHHLRALKYGDQTLGYAGRPPSASPACGSPHLHQTQQQALVDVALSERPVDDPGERLDDTDMHLLG